jgi:hypothetical protein
MSTWDDKPNDYDHALRIIDRMRAALKMGIQLCETGGHGDGESCPTCHFMRVAQEAIGEKVGKK